MIAWRRRLLHASLYGLCALSLIHCVRVEIATASSDSPSAASQAVQQVLATAAVPDEGRRQGEVSLGVRDGVVVIETFLESRLLRRVVAEITLKEEANWPRDGEGGDDSATYCRELAAAERAIWREHQREDRRRTAVPRLVIELSLSEQVAKLVIYDLPPDAEAGRAGIGERRLVAEPRLSRPYLERNLYLIAEDALGLTPEETARRIREAGAWAPSVAVDGGGSSP